MKGASRSSGGSQGRPSCAYTSCSDAASGSGPSAATYAAEPVARSSAVPNASGGVATSSIGTPSIVSPRAESITATICGSAAKRSSSDASSTHTTASCSHESRQRRVSPAGSPPSASAIAPTSARAWPSSNPRGGAGSRASASTIRASNFGPTPGTDCSRPASTAARNSAGVRTSSARASSNDRFVVSPRERPRPTSPGTSSRSSSRSSAISPVFTSSTQPRLDPRPDPAQRADPLRPHELRHRHGRGPHGLGRAAVRARLVRVGLGEVEQRGERVEPVGDRGVLHAGNRSLAPRCRLRKLDGVQSQ